MELMETLPELPGCHLYEQMEHLGLSAHVFDTNYRELESILLWVNQSDEAHDLMGNDRKRRAFFQEVTRRLHNTVAAALSLRDPLEDSSGRGTGR